MSSSHSPFGIHYLIEFGGCEPALLTDVEHLERLMEKSAREAGATVVDSVFHAYNPQGLSGVVVIAESHLAIHTWPEHQYAAIDVFTCGMPEVAEKIYDMLLTAFQPKIHHLKQVERKPPNTQKAAKTDR